MAPRYTAEEIATGVAVLGKRPDAVFLHERLILEIQSTTGMGIEGCALSYLAGRRSMAADLLKLLDLDLDDAHRDATSILRSHTAGRPSGTGRRVPAEPEGGYWRDPGPTGRKSHPGEPTKPSGVDA